MPIKSIQALGFVLLIVCLAYPSLNAAETRGIPHQRVAFVTSASGPPVFGDWPEATDPLTGVEAADSICIYLASQAGLLSPGDFRAWVSDSSDDAYCRIHNLSGKKGANCDQGALPEAAGPWVRTDGTPWAPGVPDLLHPLNRVYTTLHFDENGTPIDLLAGVWTATNREGVLPVADPTCTDWTATPSESVRLGSLERTSESWTNTGSISCDTTDELHLYCLETFPGPAVNRPEATERFAFVTSDFDDGLLADWDAADLETEGVEAGDSICNNLATTAGIPQAGSYKSWLSDMDVAAPDRFVNDGPFYRLDGFKIADSIADLLDSELLVPINVTEELEYLSSSAVYTGTNHFGVANANHCNSWKSNDGGSFMGLAGSANSITFKWTNFLLGGCSSTWRLFCLSDAKPPLSFTQGFEAK